MKNKKPQIRIVSYGRYTPWKKGSRELPRILEFTHIIDAFEGNEFGMTLLITRGRGVRLTYCIKHPSFKNDLGEEEPDFTGESRINSNHYEFYIGDSICPPFEEKAGIWEVIVCYRGKEVAAQRFEIILSKNIIEK